ncbi:hypothetical protein BJ875DRAFT_50875 [Amylocarpus encephaloides]|uniref:Uncharacterized protein n=1 Tax=Amylocarpus encephaloides TaxID=45428 RepID=A0A9P8C4L0_9HELO|nr:hypothetical protein BJ875DRAFT_50875 [Amylocarpus encephaloides]
MADLDLPTLAADDDRPIAVPRKRRSSAVPSSCGSSPLRPNLQVEMRTSRRQHGFPTPPLTPSTPKRANKRVRFSDQGPPIPTAINTTSSGLTPFIRRTNISTPKSKRKHSTPANIRPANRAAYEEPISGELQFASLRQVLDGRVKRRLRRNRLSEQINTIEWSKKHQAKARKFEVERLREELAAKDLEVQDMRDNHDIASQIEGESGLTNHTITTQSKTISELEQVIAQLRAELEQKEDDVTIDDPNWTLNARDPFDDYDDDDDDEKMMTNYDFSLDSKEEIDTTPTRLNTSFPSPPDTMPNTPETPASRAVNRVRLEPADPEKQLLKEQLEGLEADVSTLRSSIALKDDHHARLEQKLSDFLPVGESLDHTSLDAALDSVLTNLALSQSHELEQRTAFSALSNEVCNLGFSSDSPEKVIETIAQQFRQARLDLEYCTPGEVVEGFENDKLLEMLVSRTKVLIERVKRNDETIDEYHEQEVLLRQQLNTRIEINEGLNHELFLANNVVGDLRLEIQEHEVGNSRLQSALEGYRTEVSSLEKLIESMESDGENLAARLRSEVAENQERLQDEMLQHETTRAMDEGKSILMTELERRLTSALQSSAEIQSQLDALTTEHADQAANITQMHSAHADSLALLSARTTELGTELERVKAALESAEAKIHSLRSINQELVGEKHRGLLIIKAANEQLAGMMKVNMSYIDSNISIQGPSSQIGSGQSFSDNGLCHGGPFQEDAAVVRRDQFFDRQLARRLGKKRRRYDSGVDFLEEVNEEVDVET